MLAAAFVLAGPARAADRAALGGNLTLEGAVEGDVRYLGGNIDIDADVSGDIGVAGGTISIRGSAGGEVSVTGGNIAIDAVIARDLNAAGGQIDLSAETRVGGAANLAGGSLSVRGVIEGELDAAGGRVDIYGTIEDDVEVYAREIEVHPGAVILGTLSVRGPNEPVVADGTVSGEVRYEYRRGVVESWDVDWGPDIPLPYNGAVFLGAAGIAAGLFLVLVFPSFTRKATGWQGERPVSSLGLGFISLALVPAAAILSIVTVIGAPVGLFLIAVFPFVIYFGYVLGVMGLARLLLTALGSQPSTLMLFGAFAGLSLILTATTLVSGWLWIAGFLATLMGIGGLMHALFSGSRAKAVETA